MTCLALECVVSSSYNSKAQISLSLEASVLMATRTTLLPPALIDMASLPISFRSFPSQHQPPVTHSAPLPSLVPTQQYHRAGFASSQTIYLQRQFPLQIFMAKYRTSFPGLLWRGHSQCTNIRQASPLGLHQIPLDMALCPGAHPLTQVLMLSTAKWRRPRHGLFSLLSVASPMHKAVH